MQTQALVDFAPALRLALLALVIALLPLSWVWLRQRGASTQRRLAALTALTLFLTFDLIVFGAFTRLSDSGLGCPDWPGCYGEVTPFGAREEIHAAQGALPSGPVTWGKAWIEMIHRYLAMTVGVLILVMAAAAWRERRQLPFSPWWPTLTLVWVMVQGLFGKYTVTLKLYPAVVTLHLLGGLALLALLAVQHEAFRRRPLALAPAFTWAAAAGHRSGGGAGGAGRARRLGQHQLRGAGLHGLPAMQRAVVACDGRRARLHAAARTGAGPRRCGAALRGAGGHPHGAPPVCGGADGACSAWLALRLWQAGRRDAQPVLQRFGLALALLLLAQLASGLSNVVLGWPLVAALGHSAGAAGLVLVLALLLARSATGREAASAPRFSAGPRLKCAVAHDSSPRRRPPCQFTLGPVLRADQTARGAAHRVLRAHRRAAGTAWPA